jgi:hypothetical protein
MNIIKGSVVWKITKEREILNLKPYRVESLERDNDEGIDKWVVFKNYEGIEGARRAVTLMTRLHYLKDQLDIERRKNKSQDVEVYGTYN